VGVVEAHGIVPPRPAPAPCPATVGGADGWCRCWLLAVGVGEAATGTVEALGPPGAAIATAVPAAMTTTLALAVA
jgi:hypothetical protein